MRKFEGKSSSSSSSSSVLRCEFPRSSLKRLNSSASSSSSSVLRCEFPRSSLKRLKSSASSSSSCSSSIIRRNNDESHLPDDLVTEILEYLPIKSIVRFRVVSESWSALFKTPTFIRNHRIKQRRTKSGTMLLLRRRYAPPDSDHDVLSFHDLDSPEVEVRDPFPIRIPLRSLVGYETMQFTIHGPVNCIMQFIIQGPVNGIICIFDAWRIILCNPALRQFKLLPTTPWADLPVGYCRHPCESAFGVSSSGDEFKVIISHRSSNVMDHKLLSSSLVAYLYNSRTNSWSRFDHPPLWLDPPSQARAVVLNGAWHWPGRTFSSDRQTVVSFDITSEVFGELELPDSLASFDRGASLPVVLNNCLGVLYYRLRRCRDSQPIDIWVMKEYGVKESWNKLIVISPQPSVSTFLPWKDDTMFLIQIPGSREKEVLNARSGEFDSKYNDQLTSVNLKTGEMKEFQVFGAAGTSRGLIYEESLVSLY